MKRILSAILIHLLLWGALSAPAQAFMVAGVVSGSVQSAPALQNFTAYTKVDGGGNLTVNSATQVTVSNMTRAVTDYLYSDFGAGHFAGDFTILGQINTSTYINTGGIVVFSSIGSNLGQFAGQADVLGVLAQTSSSTVINFYLVEQVSPYAQYASSAIALSFGTTYYTKMTRVGTTLTLNVYSDAARTTLIATRSLTLHYIAAYRYLYAVQSANNGNAGQSVNAVIGAMTVTTP